jgi:DNA-binding CsgD family transcriptional regulator/tetratricopeptide (TPR) repeat protein
VLWLEAEDAAIHQGLAWALDHDTPTALRLAAALAPWWLIRGRWVQGIELLRRAVEQARPDAGPWFIAHLWLGHLARGTFENDTALHHYSTVVGALRAGPPSADLVNSLLGRCAVLRNTSSLAEATADARAALELARQISYATGEAMALAELGMISAYADEGDRALEWATQAQMIDRDLMPGWYARKVEGAVLFIMLESGHLDGALDLYVQALAQARQAGDLSEEADLLFFMAVLARQTGRLADARAHLRETIGLAQHASYRMRLIDAVDEGGYWCATAGQYAAAITLWSARDARARAAGLADTPAEERDRERPLQEAMQALESQQIRAAQERGTAMTLAAAAEFTILMTGEHAPESAKPPGPGRLSARERELVTLVAQGQTDAQIAEKLFISISTVRTHMDRIRDKSGCRRRADLTRLALQEGII